MNRAPEPSLLERMIARLTTQRDFLGEAARLIENVDGPILEVGLGKGRTYDHLRRLMPARTILAFDRVLHAPARATPPTANLILGDFADTLPATAARLGRVAAFAHADFGSPDRDHDARQALWLGPLLQKLVRQGGIVVTDRELVVEGWSQVAITPKPPWPYFLWRVDR